jgi:hypothetical protein
MKRLVLVIALVCLGGLAGGCALPPAATIASYALDGVSFFSTGKSVSDHAVSAVAEKDCALWRVVKGEKICRDYKDGERGLMVAFAETVTEWAVETGVSGINNDDPWVVIAPETDLTAPTQGLVAEQADGEVSSPTGRWFAAIEPAAGRAATGPDAAAPGDDKSLLLAVPADSGWRPVLTIKPRTVVQTARRPEIRVVLPQPATGGRVLVMGSFLEQANAHKSARRWQALDPSVVPSRFGGRTFFRVVAGPFDAEQVVVERKRLAKLGIRDVWSAALCPANSTGVGCIALTAGKRI